MQKRKTLKEWSTRMISETARLRDEANLENENAREDVNIHGERPYRNDKVDVAEVDVFDDDHFGTPQSEPMEEVPTSQSQERYLSISQIPRASINGNHVGGAMTSVMSPGSAILSEDPADLSSPSSLSS
jgi:hypothetical protein